MKKPKQKVNPLFTKLMEHFNHDISIVFYGEKGLKRNAVNVAIECLTDDCVLMSADKYEEEKS
jgi:hypothetical protein